MFCFIRRPSKNKTEREILTEEVKKLSQKAINCIDEFKLNNHCLPPEFIVLTQDDFSLLIKYFGGVDNPHISTAAKLQYLEWRKNPVFGGCKILIDPSWRANDS